MCVGLVRVKLVHITLASRLQTLVHIERILVDVGPTVFLLHTKITSLITTSLWEIRVKRFAQTRRPLSVSFLPLPSSTDLTMDFIIQ